MKPHAYKGTSCWRAEVRSGAVSLLMTCHMFETRGDALTYAKRWIANPEGRKLMNLIGRGSFFWPEVIDMVLEHFYPVDA
ncbi:MAG: hypothetical protein JRD89_15570 [Deltaproteobacteria bacterium]|nr:hypothetical protein [Deltaproteobacteria bacterium]